MARSSSTNLSRAQPPAVLQRYRDTAEEPSAQPWLRYDSEGCLLIIGDGDLAFSAAKKLVNSLHIVVLTKAAPVYGTAPDGIACVQGELVELSGYLGNFVAKVKGKDRALNLALLCPVERERFDLVLDLSQPPHFSMEIPPLGYYAPGSDTAALSKAMTELSALKGVFHKPRFFKYSPSLCAHGRYGIKGCNRCLEVCPTQAITENGDKIRIDPYLCQGCGTCMLVCPSGAVSYNPDLDRDYIDYICRELIACPNPSETRVIFCDARITPAQLAELDLGSNVILVELSELATQGMEAWLIALANGAGEVALLGAEYVTSHTLEALQQQLGYTQSMLAGIGYDPGRVRLLRLHDGEGLIEATATAPNTQALAAVSFNRLNGKRKNIEKALQRLVASAPTQCVSDVRLGANAPFGGLAVDKQKCSLCMGCVKSCPTNALRRAGNLANPRLGFVEGLCVQCGICAAACPEQALELLPRITLDQKQRNETQILNESPPFNCVSCGKPFTTKAIVALMSKRLKDNPFFQGEEMNKLKQCPDCRAHTNVVEQLRSINGIANDSDD